MITAAGIGWVMEGERSCISGMPADSVRTLISPGGRGRILLGRRRVPKEELLAEVRDRIAQEAPGLPTAMCGRGHPLEEVLAGAEGPLAVCVEDPACLLSLADEGVFGIPMLALVPGLTFDRFGYRLGYGGGYYDRLLAAFTGDAVGLCRQAQLADDLDARGLVCAYDQRVPVVVTENEVIR